MANQKTETTAFDFLTLRIQQILDEVGFDKVSEKTRKEFVPQFVEEAERRIGFALMPYLNESTSKDLNALLEKKDLKEEEMSAFWQKVVPNYKELVQTTLNDFAQEMKTIVGKMNLS